MTKKIQKSLLATQQLVKSLKTKFTKQKQQKFEIKLRFYYLIGN